MFSTCAMMALDASYMYRIPSSTQRALLSLANPIPDISVRVVAYSSTLNHMLTVNSFAKYDPEESVTCARAAAVAGTRRDPVFAICKSRYSFSIKNWLSELSSSPKLKLTSPPCFTPKEKTLALLTISTSSASTVSGFIQQPTDMLSVDMPSLLFEMGSKLEDWIRRDLLENSFTFSP